MTLQEQLKYGALGGIEANELGAHAEALLACADVADLTGKHDAGRTTIGAQQTNSDLTAYGRGRWRSLDEVESDTHQRHVNQVTRTPCAVCARDLVFGRTG